MQTKKSNRHFLNISINIVHPSHSTIQFILSYKQKNKVSLVLKPVESNFLFTGKIILKRSVISTLLWIFDVKIKVPGEKNWPEFDIFEIFANWKEIHVLWIHNFPHFVVLTALNLLCSNILLIEIQSLSQIGQHRNISGNPN